MQVVNASIKILNLKEKEGRKLAYEKKCLEEENRKEQNKWLQEFIRENWCSEVAFQVKIWEDFVLSNC